MINIKVKNLLSKLVILILLLGVMFSVKFQKKNQETQETKPADFSNYSFFTNPPMLKPAFDHKLKILREFMAFGIPILDSLEDQMNKVQDAKNPDENEEFKKLQIELSAYENLIHSKYIEILNKDSLIHDVNLSFIFTSADGRYLSFGPQQSSEFKRINKMREDCLYTGEIYSIIWQTDTLSGKEREIKVQRMAGSCKNEKGIAPAIFYKANADLTKKNSQGLSVSFSFNLPENLKYLDKGWKESFTE